MVKGKQPCKDLSEEFGIQLEETAPPRPRMGMSVGSRNLKKAPRMWGLGVEGKSCRQ